MASPLEGNLADAIGKAMSGLFLPATLIADTAASGPVYDPGKPSSVSYPCRAIVEEFGAYDRSQGLVSVQDRKVLVLASTLKAVPKEGNRITVQGQTYRIYSDGEGQPAVSTDPATAVWVLRCRG